MKTSAAKPPPKPPAGPQGLQPGAPMWNNGEILFTDAVAAKIAASGAGWVRLNFRLGPNFANWTDTNAFGYSALSRYDTIIDHALNNNLKVLGLLSNEAWNTTTPPPGEWQANNAEVAGGNGDNPYIQGFETGAARVLIPHFAGKIDNWQVWNEPNASLTWVYPSNFAWLLRRVYVAAKESGVPNLTIVSEIGKIDNGGGGNEPNASLTWVYPSNFAWLLRRVYVAAKESGVPNLTIVSGGL